MWYLVVGFICLISGVVLCAFINNSTKPKTPIVVLKPPVVVQNKIDEITLEASSKVKEKINEIKGASDEQKKNMFDSYLNDRGFTPKS